MSFDPHIARTIAKLELVDKPDAQQQLNAASLLVEALIETFPKEDKPEALQAWAVDAIDKLRKGHALPHCRYRWIEGLIQAPDRPAQPSGFCSEPRGHEGDHIFPNNNRRPQRDPSDR